MGAPGDAVRAEKARMLDVCKAVPNLLLELRRSLDSHSQFGEAGAWKRGNLGLSLREGGCKPSSIAAINLASPQGQRKLAGCFLAKGLTRIQLSGKERARRESAIALAHQPYGGWPGPKVPNVSREFRSYYTGRP